MNEQKGITIAELEALLARLVVTASTTPDGVVYAFDFEPAPSRGTVRLLSDARKDAKAETQLIHLKATSVAFCCNNCQKKFLEKEKMELVDKGPKTCKVCDKEAKADQSVLANGEKIYFCCGECKASWQKKLHLTSTEGTKCPLSGKDVNKDTELVVVKSNAVYFCCDNCKGKYLKETILKGEGEGAKKAGKDKID